MIAHQGRPATPVFRFEEWLLHTGPNGLDVHEDDLQPESEASSEQIALLDL